MTINVEPSALIYNASVDPGRGLDYYYYQGTSDDSYNVFVDDVRPGPNPYYFAFALQSADWNGADTIVSQLPSTFKAGAGDDLLYAGSEFGEVSAGVPLTFLGGAGADSINPLQQFDPSDSDVIIAYGGSQNDSINGSDSADTRYGDTVSSFTGYPVISDFTQAPYDTSGDGDDIISGHGGDDTISSDGADDQLDGGEGADTLSGGDGDDFLYGGSRGGGYLDILTGGTGADAFVLSYAQGAADTAGAGFWFRRSSANNQLRLLRERGNDDDDRCEQR